MTKQDKTNAKKRLKKFDFLNRNDLVIDVKNKNWVENIKYSNGGYYGTLRKGKSENSEEIDFWFQDFIKLGKKIFEEFPNYIRQIGYIYNPNGMITIDISYVDTLILDKQIINDSKLKPIIENWCKRHSVVLYPDSFQFNCKLGKRIEVDTLLDMAVFSYLVLSALNNHRYLKLIEQGYDKYKKDYDKGNKITFSNIIKLNCNDIDDFYKIITNTISQYQRLHGTYFVGKMVNGKIKNTDEFRPLIMESTELSYDDHSQRCKLARKFENIYSLFFLILKAQIYAFDNENTIFYICRCGSIIVGKSEHCDACKRAIDSERKRKH